MTQTKIVYQIDRAGVYLGETVADESPLEPGVWLMPAGTIDAAPPANWPADKWPRWNGVEYVLGNAKPLPAVVNDPVAKLQAFLAANPDVAAIL
jgi:hypothetical protein